MDKEERELLKTLDTTLKRTNEVLEAIAYMMQLQMEAAGVFRPDEEVPQEEKDEPISGPPVSLYRKS